MPQVIEQSDIFGRIGKNIGQGVGEQLERSQLAGQLKKIKGFPEQAANVISSPGGREILPTVLPYIQSHRQKELVRGLNPKDSVESYPSAPSSQPYSPQSNNRPIPPKFDREAANYLIPTDPNLLNQEAIKLSDETGIPYDQVRDQLAKNDSSRIATETAFEQRNTVGEQEFDKYLSSDLQKSGDDTYKAIVGAMQNDYKAKVQQLIAEGKSPKQAASQVARDLLDFAQVRTQVSTEGGLKAYATTPSRSREQVKAARKSYADAGQLELYKNDLISKIGMKEPFAEALAYPVSGNKEIVDLIKENTKKIGGVYVPTKFNESSPKSYEKIALAIKPSDSINAIALALDEHGYDPDQFRRVVSQQYEDGKISLDKRQARELTQAGIDFIPSLTDIWYTSLWGKKSGI